MIHFKEQIILIIIIIYSKYDYIIYIYNLPWLEIFLCVDAKSEFWFCWSNQFQFFKLLLLIVVNADCGVVPRSIWFCKLFCSCWNLMADSREFNVIVFVVCADIVEVSPPSPLSGEDDTDVATFCDDEFILEDVEIRWSPKTAVGGISNEVNAEEITLEEVDDVAISDDNLYCWFCCCERSNFWRIAKLLFNVFWSV